jgi:hypothetical protein
MQQMCFWKFSIFRNTICKKYKTSTYMSLIIGQSTQPLIAAEVSELQLSTM